MPEKTCNRCKTIKSLESFHDNKASKDGKKSICNACSNKVSRKWKLQNRESLKQSRRDWHLKNKYGLTPSQYEYLQEKQNYRCAICGATENKGKVGPSGEVNFVVDHCHESGEVRGLLCNSCNRGIGLLKDSPDVLLNAVSYLQETRQ